MIWLPLNARDRQRYVELRLYSPENEKIHITFNPLKMSAEPDWDPQWEEWNCYAEPLRIFLEDYNILLKDHFAVMYPTVDAFDKTPESAFDVTSFNWLGRADWQKVISAIEGNIAAGALTDERAAFYSTFLDWLKQALEHTEIIVAEGNL